MADCDNRNLNIHTSWCFGESQKNFYRADDRGKDALSCECLSHSEADSAAAAVGKKKVRVASVE